MNVTIVNPPTIVPPPAGPDTSPKLAVVGDDGSYVVGFGVIEPALFVVMAMALHLTSFGIHALDETDFSSSPGPTMSRLVKAVETRWAIEVFDVTAATTPEHRLHWEGISDRTPGAFQITVIELD